MELLWVGLGGGLGAVTRYLLGLWVAGRVGSTFPYHTLLINVSGSLAIGILLVLLTERLATDPAWRLFLVIGALGGYTTFSSFTYEALALVESGDLVAAALYVFGSNALGLLAAYAGIVVTRTIVP